MEWINIIITLLFCLAVFITLVFFMIAAHPQREETFGGFIADLLSKLFGPAV